MTKKYRWIFGILITICMSIILILISSIALDYHRNVWRYLGGPVSDGIVPQKVIEWLLIVTPGLPSSSSNTTRMSLYSAKSIVIPP